MSIDVFSIECDALQTAKLVGFKGVEALNRPFEFDLFFTVPVGTDVRSAIGRRATLTADRDDDRGPMRWQGILAGIRLLHETAERALYRASLVPKLWILGQYVRSFVHTKKKIDAYVGDTLKHGGLQGGDFDFKIHTGAYPQEEFVCQYRESHLDFVHRWLEREGIYYYFEHPEGAGAVEKMVMVDDKAQHGPLLGDGRVRYFPAEGLDGSAGECLRELHADFRLLPASVLVTDYNYGNPNAPVAGEKPVTSGGQGEIREYGYRVFTEGEAKRLAQVKAQSIACRELVLTASGTYLGLRAGYTFEVEDGPSDLPSKYLAIEVRHAGVVSGAAPLVKRYTGLDAKETYRVDVTAIPADVQYRAPQSTAWPRIYGFENGTVDGPGESQYAQIDDQGRYLVRFKFDASQLPDGSTSTYLRMMQPHGGTTEGMHFPLRKGTEVMVSFQGGDPDRPVIAGVVPNAVQPSNVTNRNHTQNVIKSGGGNYMLMDDIDGAQTVQTYTPVRNTSVKMGAPVIRAFSDYGDTHAVEVEINYDVATEGNAGFWVGGGWWEDVGKTKNVHVHGAVTIGYDSTYKIDIGGKSDEFYHSVRNTTVTGVRTETLNAGGSRKVDGNWTDRVTGNLTAYVGAKYKLTAGGTIEIGSAGGTVTLSSPTEISLSAPKVDMHGGFIRMNGSNYVELYDTRTTVGAHKSDYAVAVYTCGYAFKLETTGMGMGFFGAKSDTCGSKKDTAGLLISDVATKLSSGAVTVKNTAVTVARGIWSIG